MPSFHANAEADQSPMSMVARPAVLLSPQQDALPLLDDPLEWSAFSREVADRPGCWESNVVIEGMHCAACAMTVEDALLRVPGVVSAQVSGASQRARVVWAAARVLPSIWMGAVSAAGYGAVPANDAFASERRRHESRQALWRMSVAGFCMMQVMMYAWPAYVARPGDLTAEMEQLLRWASWVLTLPVILFSCGPFFSNALRDLAQRRVSMDLPVALGMGMTFVVSSIGTFNPEGIFGREVYFDSLTMFVFFLLTGRWLELRLRDRTAGALDALMNRLPDSVQRRCLDGRFERVAVRRLHPQDVIRVLPGEAFPADGVLVEGQTLVDEALLTGESRPLARALGEAVIAGSHNLGASVLVCVERVGAQTRFAQIVALMESASVDKPHMAQMADRIAKPFLILVLLAAGLAAAYAWTHDPAHAVMVAVAVLVVTCPCALSLATPAAMLATAGALARKGILVRRLQAMETLASIDTVVFDKTGTLTSDTMGMAAVQTRADLASEQALALAAALAQHSLHPVSKALCAAWQKTCAVTGEAAASPALWSATDVQETMGLGVTAQVRALAPELATFHATTVRLGSAAFCGVSAPETAAMHVFLSDERGWLATFELQEQVRDDALQCVQALLADGIEVRLLSGDLTQAVRRVANLTGIALAKGGCAPEDKLVYLRQVQQQGRRVAMVGDGLNDGPVLAGAHVSFAVGLGVPLARAQADFVILGGHLAGVAQTLRQSRRTVRVVRQNLWWAALYNALCVPLAVVGWLPAWVAGLGMAASSLLVVLNALRLSDGPIT
jgi:Cu2+-exporting ATPase